MKNILLFTLIILIFTLPVLADEIYLNDGRIIKGKIIKVTGTGIEYDPEGEKAFDIFPRGQITKIIFDNGSEIILNEGAGKTSRDDTTKNEEKPSQESNTKNGINTHDGLYLRFLYGGGHGEAKVKDYPDTTLNEKGNLEIEGSAGMFVFQLGYAFESGLILYGEFGGYAMTEPKVKWKGVEEKNTGTKYSTGTFGAGLSYYFMPINIYLSATLCFSSGNIEGRKMNTDKIFGSGVLLAVGKEWWISDNWGIGVAIFYYSGNMKTDEINYAEQFEITDKYYGIAFSATYN